MYETNHPNHAGQCRSDTDNTHGAGMTYTDYQFDIECLPNLFTLIAHRLDDDSRWKFIISPWENQGRELNFFLHQLKESNGRMVGYNNVGYDYPMVHFIMTYNGNVDNTMLYTKSRAIVTADFNDRSHQIWDNERFIPQIDLMRVHHFDNKAKLTSLKLLEFNMRMNSIEELELDFDYPVKQGDIPVVLKYNDHDVTATGEFYKYSKAEIAFRDALTQKYGKDFSNHNDTKIGQDFFVMELAKKGIKAGKWNQTYRSHINVGEIILPYIKFDRPEFNEILNFFRETVINPEMIKGFFGSRDKSQSKCTAMITRGLADAMDPNDVTVYYTDKTKSTYAQLDSSKQISHMTPVNIHCEINGFRFDFGAGGIHGSILNTVVIPNSNQKLKDSDVSSYYPNLAIKNRLYPLHLGETFCDVYLAVYEQRKQYEKKTAENNMLKLALNGVYGKSNDKHSPFYDPQYTMAITINGQLLLCMLAEKLMALPRLQMVQMNTDGLTYLYPAELDEEVCRLASWWESLTKLELEHVEYSKMAIRDVNSYLAVTKPYIDKKSGKLTKPKIKRIGAYAYERASENPGTRELPWHKDHSAVVIAKAAEAALVRGENIEKFIRNHLSVDPLDFMLRTKINRSDSLVLETPVMWGNDVVSTSVKPMQRVTRYFISNSGGYLIKLMDPTDEQCKNWAAANHWRHKVNGTHKVSKKAPSGMYIQCKPPTEKPPIRRTGVDAGFKVTIANNLTGLDMSDVNIDYYVNRARKLVDPLLRNQ